jgi:serine/threonine protein kinase
MSDTTVRGTAVCTNRLWAAFLGGPRSRTRTTKVNRPCAAVYRDITPQSNTAPQQQHGSAHEVPTREGPTSMCSPDLGYSRQLSRRYDIGQQLGSGGNAIVYMAQDRFTHKVLACKSISKSAGSSATQAKTAEHIEAIKREVRVLQQLRGSLNVACLEEVYEDDTHVHLLLEYCKGGELAHRIGTRHYSERTVCNS